MAKKIVKLASWTIGVLLTLVLLFICYIVFFLPRIGVPQDLKIISTTQRIEHGKYLAQHVSGCIDCHSKRDETKYAGPLTEGSLGQGGFVFNAPEGRVVAPNITPDGIGDWTDGELFRAITEGVSRDGRPLFPIMPYLNFGKMDREDIYDIMAYIRTLPRIHHAVEKTSLHFPINIIVHTIPHSGSDVKKPEPSDLIAYGRYMVNSAGCANCHSPKEKGKDIPGLEFGGGFAIPLANGGIVRTANITPDPETGIGGWSQAQFVERFKACLDSSYTHPVGPADPQTEMPWTFFAGMQEKDLEAIYAYLRTVKPVKNKVMPFAELLPDGRK